MGSGVAAILALVAAAACLTLAPAGTFASSRQFDHSVGQSNRVNSTGALSVSMSRLALDPSRSKRLSWHPRVFLYEGFLSEMECSHLISMAHSKVVSSLVVNGGARNSSQSNAHIDIKVYLADGKGIVVSNIEDRISLWTFLPKDYGGSIQILKYGVKKIDYNKVESQSSSGGDRLVTILMYLSDVKQGGETVFPRSKLKDTQAQEGRPSECPGYAVKPVKGNAILLFNVRPDGVIDKDSQYKECSVLEGEKWLAIRHFHLRKIDSPNSTPTSNDECTDEDDRCVNWAAAGECDKNPIFMIGSPDYYGTCRKSCGVC